MTPFDSLFFKFSVTIFVVISEVNAGVSPRSPLSSWEGWRVTTLMYDLSGNHLPVDRAASPKDMSLRTACGEPVSDDYSVQR